MPKTVRRKAGTRLRTARRRLAEASHRRLELARAVRKLPSGTEREHQSEYLEATRLEVDGLRREVRSFEAGEREDRERLRRREASVLRRGGVIAKDLRKVRKDIAEVTRLQRTLGDAARAGQRALASIERRGSVRDRIQRSGRMGGRLGRSFEELEKQRSDSYLRWITSRLGSRIKRFTDALEGADLPASAKRIRRSLAKKRGDPATRVQELEAMLRHVDRRAGAMEEHLEGLRAKRMKILARDEG